MAMDVQRHLNRWGLKCPRQPLSTATFAAGLKARLNAMAWPGPFCATNSTET